MDYGGVDPKFVNYLNVPFIEFGFSPAQLIKKKVNHRVEQSLSSLYHFLVPSTGLLALIAAGGLLYLLFAALFSLAKRPLRPSRKRLQLKIVSFFYLIFLFFIQIFFESNLNTSNIVVRTDDLLYSLEQVLQTQREFCFLEKSREAQFLQNVSSPLRILKGFESLSSCNA